MADHRRVLPSDGNESLPANGAGRYFVAPRQNRTGSNFSTTIRESIDDSFFWMQELFLAMNSRSTMWANCAISPVLPRMFCAAGDDESTFS